MTNEDDGFLKRWAQRKVEAHNFDIRKHLLEYDDVMKLNVLEGRFLEQRDIDQDDNVLASYDVLTMVAQRSEEDA